MYTPWSERVHAATGRGEHFLLLINLWIEGGKVAATNKFRVKFCLFKKCLTLSRPSPTARCNCRGKYTSGGAGIHADRACCCATAGSLPGSSTLLCGCTKRYSTNQSRSRRACGRAMFLCETLCGNGERGGWGVIGRERGTREGSHRTHGRRFTFFGEGTVSLSHIHTHSLSLFHRSSYTRPARVVWHTGPLCPVFLCPRLFGIMNACDPMS